MKCFKECFMGKQSVTKGRLYKSLHALFYSFVFLGLGFCIWSKSNPLVAKGFEPYFILVFTPLALWGLVILLIRVVRGLYFLSRVSFLKDSNDD